jgi:hypothetical protein
LKNKKKKTSSALEEAEYYVSNDIDKPNLEKRFINDDIG